MVARDGIQRHYIRLQLPLTPERTGACEINENRAVPRTRYRFSQAHQRWKLATTHEVEIYIDVAALIVAVVDAAQFCQKIHVPSMRMCCISTGRGFAPRGEAIKAEAERRIEEQKKYELAKIRSLNPYRRRSVVCWKHS